MTDHASSLHSEDSFSEGAPEYEPELENDEFDKVIDDLTRERDEAKDLYLRTLADLQNVRRRAAQEKEELRKFATEQLVRDLLPVLDNFERAMTAIDQGATLESVLEGVKLVDRQLRTVLESVKLSRIPALGMPFDPEHHEAIGSDVTEEHPEGTITAEVEPGYKMGGRVVRPARVRVSKKA